MFFGPVSRVLLKGSDRWQLTSNDLLQKRLKTLLSRSTATSTLPQQLFESPEQKQEHNFCPDKLTLSLQSIWLRLTELRRSVVYWEYGGSPVWWTWCRGCRGRWRSSRCNLRPAGYGATAPGCKTAARRAALPRPCHRNWAQTAVSAFQSWSSRSTDY